jgi:hypothetical protein
MSLDALVDEVRRRRTPDEALHLTAIAVLADSELAGQGDDQIALALAGWAAVRAEGATETYPTLSAPSLALVRSGVTLTDRIFTMLPKDDRASLVCIGFLGIIAERLGERPGSRRRRRRPQGERAGDLAKPRPPLPTAD